MGLAEGTELQRSASELGGPRTCVFPFGEPVRKVIQTDRRPKQVFVLGVYSSAVHARWLDPAGRTVVAALAVCSEPYIFWRGDGVDDLVRGVSIPPAVGTLRPAHPGLNGPSGIALDERILAPLGISREDAWLCDLVPQSCMNDAQERAIQRAYLPLVSRHLLPTPTVPRVPTPLGDRQRTAEIIREIGESRAQLIVLLGDEPIRHLLTPFDRRWRWLVDFGVTPETYGRVHEIVLDGQRRRVLPLAHPRQVARLGTHSKKWFGLHEQWRTDEMRRLTLGT